MDLKSVAELWSEATELRRLAERTENRRLAELYLQLAQQRETAAATQNVEETVWVD